MSTSRCSLIHLVRVSSEMRDAFQAREYSKTNKVAETVIEECDKCARHFSHGSEEHEFLGKLRTMAMVLKYISTCSYIAEYVE